jgi:hypothetical protein
MDGKKVQHITGILTEKQTTIIEFNKPLRSEDHPTMKPVDLFYLFNEKIVLSKVILLAIHSLVLAPL